MFSTTAIRRSKILGFAELSRDERGLTTVEYVIILVLLAVGSMGLWRAFGGSIGTKINDSSESIRTMTAPESQEGSGASQTPTKSNSNSKSNTNVSHSPNPAAHSPSPAAQPPTSKGAGKVSTD